MTWCDRTAGIAAAITSGLVSSSNTRSRGASNRRSPATTVTRGKVASWCEPLARERDLVQPERRVEVDAAQLRQPQRRQLARNDRDERREPLGHARPERQRRIRLRQCTVVDRKSTRLN